MQKEAVTSVLLRGRLSAPLYDGRNRVTLAMRYFLQDGEKNDTTENLTKAIPNYRPMPQYYLPYVLLRGNGDFASVYITYHKSDSETWQHMEHMLADQDVEILAQVRRYRYTRNGKLYAGTSLTLKTIRPLKK